MHKVSHVEDHVCAERNSCIHQIFSRVHAGPDLRYVFFTDRGFFRELAAYMARTVNDAQFQVDSKAVINTGLGVHYSFLEHWFVRKPPR